MSESPEVPKFYGIESEGLVVCVPEPKRAPWRAIIVWRKDERGGVIGTCQHLAELLDRDAEARR